MSKIEWTNETWNPLVGCSLQSPGCTNCYAMNMAYRQQAMGTAQYAGTAKKTKAGPVWTGKVNFVESALLKPLSWKKPRLIFVNSMSDMFHPDVPFEWIDRIFAVMALSPQHTFQCLTKRADRMRAYCSSADITQRIAKAIDAVHVDLEHSQTEEWRVVPGHEPYEASSHGRVRRNGEVLREQINPLYGRPSVTVWRSNEPTTVYVHKLVLLAHCGQPSEGEEAGHRNGNQADNRLANLRWVSRSQNQAEKVRHGSNGGPAKLTRGQAAEIRLKRKAGAKQQALADEYGVSRSLISMIETGAVWPEALKWPLPNVWLGVSVEDQKRADERIPDLLETPAAKRFLSCEPLLGPVGLTDVRYDGITSIDALRGKHGVAGKDGDCAAIDWVIVGGESGKSARPMHPDWARTIRDQCAEANVPFFFKQWGAWEPHTMRAGGDLGADVRNGTVCTVNPSGRSIFEQSALTGRGGERGCVYMKRVGKRAAGRLLDGQEHNGKPEVTA